MDLICTCCGEPWAIDHVLHEDTTSLTARAGLFAAVLAVTVPQPEGMTEEQAKQA